MAIFKNADLYIADAYAKLHTLGVAIINNYVDGFGNSAKQKQLWDQHIRINKILRTVLHYCVFDTAGNFLGIYRIEEADFNRLLGLLIDTGDLLPNPLAPKLLFNGIPSFQVGGISGPPGTDGQSAYVYIGFAQDASGNGYNAAPGSGRPYIAFKNSNIPLTVAASIFAGLWVNYFGAAGADGVDGTDGLSSYVHVAWADDDSGTGFTLTFSALKKYIAFLVNNDPADPIVDDFAGIWSKYVGDNGTNGTNGNTIYSGSGAPSSGLGVDGDFYVDIDGTRTFYGPKTSGSWGGGFSLVGGTGAAGVDGADGAAGADGANAFIYVAYADDASGTGFTIVFDPDKDYIAVLQTNTGIPSPVVTDFTGLWTRYRGTGDRWSTNSNTSLTIGTGVTVLIVETNLSYSTGQRVVISVPSDPTNRMEGVCDGYDPIAGQLTVDVDTVYGSGTFASWDVSLQGAPISIASAEGYYGSMGTDQGSGGTGQSVSTSLVKLTQFDTVISQSAGMDVDAATNKRITVDNRGAYVVSANGSLSCANAIKATLQIYQNGVALNNMVSNIDVAAGKAEDFVVNATVENVAASDYFEVFIKIGSGTETVLLEQGRFDLHTVGAPNTSQFAQMTPAAVDLISVIVDSFSAGDGNYVVWEVLIKKSTTDFRGITVKAIWDGTNQPAYIQSTPNDIGTIDVTLSVDFNAGDIRLNAIGTSTGWTVEGIRTIVA